MTRGGGGDKKREGKRGRAGEGKTAAKPCCQRESETEREKENPCHPAAKPCCKREREEREREREERERERERERAVAAMEAVPRAWELAPMATPRGTGCRDRKSTV